MIATTPRCASIRQCQEAESANPFNLVVILTLSTLDSLVYVPSVVDRSSGRKSITINTFPNMLVPKVEGSGEFLPVSAVARELQTSPATVRRWCDWGHLDCVVHPVNHYRFVRRASVENLKSQIIVRFSGGVESGRA